MQKRETRLSIGKAAEYLGVSVDTLRRWEKKGRITPYRSPGGHRYFEIDDLNKLFDKKYTRDKKPEVVSQPQDIKSYKSTTIPQQSITTEPERISTIEIPPVKPTPVRPIPRVEEISPKQPATKSTSAQPTLSDEQQEKLDQILQVEQPAKKVVEEKKVKKTKKMTTSKKIGIGLLIIFAIADAIIFFLYFSTRQTLLSPVP
jgi:excisionase family DNA binding protein